MLLFLEFRFVPHFVPFRFKGQPLPKSQWAFVEKHMSYKNL